ncbi:hypothetical protein [Rubritalea sp.]|uniref:hypothetical protein n=1 Tax=Rubritalea sp. TaxID=2109375 RepID=UPI003EF8455B
MDIKGISASEIELLEAAGYLGVDTFRITSPEDMLLELERANGVLSIVEQVPSLETIVAWRHQIVGEPQQDTELEEPLPSTSSEEDALLREEEDAELPFAQPLSRKFIARHQIDVESLPQLVESVVSGSKAPRIALPSPHGKLVKTVSNEQKNEIEVQKLRSIEDARGEKISVSALPRKNGEVDRTKVVNPETNEGVDPNSRNYVRGVLHNDPVGTTFGAYTLVLSQLLLVSAIAPITYILMNPDEYMWGLLSPALVIVALLVYFSSARRTACPVCRQRQFVPKSCLKHNKAHHIRGFGYMLPTAIHLICFHWFRCIFCGTSIRVKE